MELILISILVLGVGAYLGAVADRFSYWFHVSRGMMWRKHCIKCFSFDAWMTYMPVFGYVLRRGTCSSCNEKLPIAPVLAEVVGVLSIGFIWFFGWGAVLPTNAMEVLNAALALFAMTGMLVLAISDLVYDEVPFAVYLLTLAALIGRIMIFSEAAVFMFSMFAGIVSGFVMSILMIVSKWRWVHAHDILLGILIGIIVGWPGFFITLAFAYIFAIFGGIVDWGWGKRMWKGASSYGLYLFFALAAHAVLQVISALA
jgi:prepilin signal peptidase PulO-like enzyme (type II secretory pathway)